MKRILLPYIEFSTKLSTLSTENGHFLCEYLQENVDNLCIKAMNFILEIKNYIDKIVYIE